MVAHRPSLATVALAAGVADVHPIEGPLRCIHRAALVLITVVTACTAKGIRTTPCRHCARNEGIAVRRRKVEPYRMNHNPRLLQIMNGLLTVGARPLPDRALAISWIGRGACIGVPTGPLATAASPNVGLTAAREWTVRSFGTNRRGVVQ
jgi:hypothetical protein